MRIHIQNLPSTNGEPITAAQWADAAARAGLSHHQVTLGETKQDYAAAIPQAEALVTATRCMPELFPAEAPKLRMIFCTSAGLDAVPFADLPPGVAVLNNSGVHAPKAGEYGIMAILMLANMIPQFVMAQHAQSWKRVPGSVLEGRRVTVLGLGSLGGAVAERAAQFGMRVTGVRTTAKPHPACERVVATAELDGVLPETEFLVVACPLTQATRNIIDARRLDRLPSMAGVVNIGRGPLIDQDALCDRLDDGRLAGAVLDVFVPEPVPAGHRLWTTRNLVMTPHMSCDDAKAYNPRSLDTFLQNVVAFEAGQSLPNLFLPDRGY